MQAASHEAGHCWLSSKVFDQTRMSMGLHWLRRQLWMSVLEVWSRKLSMARSLASAVNDHVQAVMVLKLPMSRHACPLYCFAPPDEADTAHWRADMSAAKRLLLPITGNAVVYCTLQHCLEFCLSGDLCCVFLDCSYVESVSSPAGRSPQAQLRVTCMSTGL